MNGPHDIGSHSPLIPPEQWADYYRACAVDLRHKADTAPSVEARTTLLEAAVKYDQLAENVVPLAEAATPGALAKNSGSA